MPFSDECSLLLSDCSLIIISFIKSFILYIIISLWPLENVHNIYNAYHVLSFNYLKYNSRCQNFQSLKTIETICVLIINDFCFTAADKTGWINSTFVKFLSMLLLINDHFPQVSTLFCQLFKMFVFPMPFNKIILC